MSVSGDNIFAVTDDSFEREVIQSKTPVLVDFWAEWCGPCKMMGPILEELAPQYTGKMSVATVNIDENNMTPQRFGVRGIPTLMLFKEGELIASKVGVLSKSQLEAFLESNLIES